MSQETIIQHLSPPVMKGAPGKLLIVSCSQRKLAHDGPVAAWSLYDGVAFRMMKRLQREKRFPAPLRILILSARYGLIEPASLINHYDQRMTSGRALELAEDCRRQLQKIIAVGSYTEIFAPLGRTYLLALQPFSDWLPAAARLIVPSGGIGLKLQALKIWLTATN